MSTRRYARDLHARFRTLPGSDHIATRSAIEGLVRALEQIRPRRVLEVGAGIGTLTTAAVETLTRLHGAGRFRLVSIEDHPFCLEQLARNCAPLADGFEVIPDVDALAADEPPFDLVITDGGRHQDPRLFRRLAPGATVYIEGDRKVQAATLESAIGERPFVKANVRLLRRRAMPGGWVAWDGGYRLYRLEPRWHDRLRFLALNLRTKAVYLTRIAWRLLPGTG